MEYNDYISFKEVAAVMPHIMSVDGTIERIKELRIALAGMGLAEAANIIYAVEAVEHIYKDRGNYSI